MSDPTQIKQAKQKAVIFTKMLKAGKSKAEAIEVLKKKFGKGLDTSMCSKIARKLGISNGEMKTRGKKYLNGSIKAPPKLTTTAEEVGFTGKLPKELFDFIATWKTVGPAHGFSDLHIVGEDVRVRREAADIKLSLK